MTTELIERTAGVLSREQLHQLILGDPPLLTAYLDLDSQLQPNGFDLTLE